MSVSLNVCECGVLCVKGAWGGVVGWGAAGVGEGLRRLI